MSTSRRMTLLFAALGAAGVLLPTGANAFTQLPGEDGCAAPRPEEGCRVANGTQSVTDVAVSPDGHSVYASSGSEDFGAVLSFRRDAKTGRLTQLAGRSGCISADGLNAQKGLDLKAGLGVPTCGRAKGLREASQVAVSPDGRRVYVVGGDGYSSAGDAITIFGRASASGRLTYRACLNRLGGGGCRKTLGLDEVQSILLSPDGRDVYVGGAVVGAFRVTAAGLKPTGCLIAPPDPTLGAGTEGCTPDARLVSADALSIAPDGTSVYVTFGSSDFGRVSTLRRDPATGALTPVGCVSDSGDTPCSRARALSGATDAIVSPDGRFAYVPASYATSPEEGSPVQESSGVVVLARDPGTGLLTQLPGTQGCALYAGARDKGCAAGPGLFGASAAALSPDGSALDVAFFDGAAVLSVARDVTTGTLGAVRPGCLATDRKRLRGCRRGRALRGAQRLAAVPGSVYVTTETGLAMLRP